MAFPYAENNVELKNLIDTFNYLDYQNKLEKIMKERFGFFGDGHATEAVVEWMIDKTNEFRQT